MNEPKAKALPFQKDGVRGMERFGGRTLLADEQGLGKTLQALWLLSRNPDWMPALVVCPGVAKYHWEHEIAHNMGQRAWVLEGQTPPKDIPRFKPKILIINYEILHHWTRYLEQLGLKAIIFDECQYLANPAASRTKAARRMALECEHVIGLSGTPLLNRPRELFPILNMINPFVFNSWQKFAHQFCDPKYKAWGWTYDGATNLDELHELLVETCMIRRLKKDVLKSLPPKVRHVVPLRLSSKALAEYTKANGHFLKWLRTSFGAGKAAKAAKAERMVKMGYMKRLSAKLKCRQVVDWTNGMLGEHGKLVLFAHHQKMIQAVERNVPYKSVTIDGNTNGRERDLARRQFQFDKTTGLCLGSMAATTALTLTAANHLGFAELWWRPGDHSQAEDRIHRISQTRQANAYYLVAEGTIEEHLCQVIQEKQAVIGATLDGDNAQDLAIFDQLTERLL